MTDKTFEEIAKRLKKLRLKNGFSQAALAKKAGINKNSYSKIERGDRKPTIETLEKLTKALGAKGSDLVPF